eukprot:6326047-Alexandrium_andersonii.AAC.1
MSASLVGSEMCIRDRAGHARGQGRQGGAGPPARRRRPGHAAGSCTRSACLLYTSDAADDM